MPVVHQEYIANGQVDIVTDEAIQVLDKLAARGKKLMILTSRTEPEVKHLLDPDHHLAGRLTAFYGDDDDENCLAAHEGPQSKLDQRPGITDGLAFRPWQERADEIDGALTLEDPVRRRREHEEHADDHLERDTAVFERGVDQT